MEYLSFRKISLSLFNNHEFVLFFFFWMRFWVDIYEYAFTGVICVIKRTNWTVCICVHHWQNNKSYTFMRPGCIKYNTHSYMTEKKREEIICSLLLDQHRIVSLISEPLVELSLARAKLDGIQINDLIMLSV